MQKYYVSNGLLTGIVVVEAERVKKLNSVTKLAASAPRGSKPSSERLRWVADTILRRSREDLLYSIMNAVVGGVAVGHGEVVIPVDPQKLR